MGALSNETPRQTLCVAGRTAAGPAAQYVESGERLRRVTGDGSRLDIGAGGGLRGVFAAAAPPELWQTAGQNAQAVFLAGLHKWTRLAGAAALPPVLVYGGDENMSRQGVAVQSWRQICIKN